MLQLLKCRVIAGTVLIAVVWLCGVSYGWTCAGSENETNEGGNYPLGCPMGGIGAGNFNFLPSGLYNQTFVRVASDANAMPTCYAFQKRGTTVISATLQHGSGNITTTFTGYWPTVLMNYHQTTLLDSIALKCFSPIITGDGIASDNHNSSLPIAIYKFTLTNNTASYDTAAIALSNGANATIIKNGAATRVIGIKNGTICVMVDTAKSNASDSITCGNSTTGFTTTGLLNNGAAGYLAKRVVVGPNSSSTITFCVSWTNIAGYYQRYSTDAQTLAAYGRDSAVSLEAKVDNWHNKILNSNVPAWFKDVTINSLYVYNCMTDWTGTTGIGTYGMMEAMNEGNYGTNDQAYHAHFALPLFAPDAEWSQVTRMANNEAANGKFAHLYDGSDGIRVDVGQKFILEIYRDYQWTGNTSELRLLYAKMQNAITGIRSEDTRNTDGLTDDTDMITYDNPYWDGWNIPSKEYDNELYLGALKAMIKSAVVNGTPADTTNYQNYFNTTSTSFERNTNATYVNSGYWDATNGYYTGSSSALNTGIPKAKAVWEGMFAGQWFADLCGLGPLHPEGRIESALSFINTHMLDQRNPPCYALMMAYPDVNCSGATPTSTYFQNSCVTYCAYPAGDLCAAFGHNRADVAFRALHAFWNDMFSKYLRVYNMPCKMTLAGNGTDWGIDRYMNSPCCLGAIFGITGFSIDYNAKILRIKPSLPTSAQYKMDSLVSGPLLNPISCGTVDYRNNTTSSVQRFVIKFDNPMQFNTFYTKKLYGQSVSVLKPAVGGSSVAATIAVNPADTSEYQVTFGSTLTIDNTGVLITIPSQVGTRYNEPAKMTPVEFTADMKRGTLSYVLHQRTKVNLVLVDARGIAVMRLESEENAGQHVVRPDWKNLAAGIYYAHFTAGDANSVKKLVYVK
jgi:uncharacterized protein (DUF608 family)